MDVTDCSTVVLHKMDFIRDAKYTDYSVGVQKLSFSLQLAKFIFKKFKKSKKNFI